MAEKYYFAEEIVLEELATTALEYLRSLEDTPDLLPQFIFLDINMPEMNGFDTFQQIRARGILTPIIALTADTFEETRLDVERFGFEAILLKPYNLVELKELLQNVLK